ncbi:hypothetical protein [Arthronema virus TR020]|uniref:Uncharacterized protein n=1 Tax=Arthronema virus TR020 TaxID=2736280 RepID=A0A7G3WH35_9CAUD|nr:hypothetical protein [Arthronema virus TR020]
MTTTTLYNALKNNEQTELLAFVFTVSAIGRSNNDKLKVALSSLAEVIQEAVAEYGDKPMTDEEVRKELLDFYQLLTIPMAAMFPEVTEEQLVQELTADA